MRKEHAIDKAAVRRVGRAPALVLVLVLVLVLALVSLLRVNAPLLLDSLTRSGLAFEYEEY